MITGPEPVIFHFKTHASPAPVHHVVIRSMWTIKKLDYSSSPWRLLDEQGQEVYEDVTIDHPEVGKSRVSMPVCGATKQEVMQKVIAGFVKLRCSAKKQRLALQIIQTWAACDGTSLETRSKAMDDIVNKCREALC